MLWRSVSSSRRTCLATDLGRKWPWYPAGSPRFYAYTRKAPNEYANQWSEEEDEKLLQLRADGKLPEEILEYLPGRTLSAVCSRMYGASLRPKMLARGLLAKFKPDLSITEIEHIRSLRSQEVPWRKILHEYPGRSFRAVKRTINKFEGHKLPVEPRKRKLFSLAEDELLLHYRDNEFMRWPDIFARMPDRSPSVLWTRYQRLVRPAQRRSVPRVGAFTQSEAEELIHLRDSGLSWLEMARRMGKSLYGVRMRYLNEKYFKDEEPKQGPWTEEEDQRLRDLSGRGGKAYIEHAVKELRRSPNAVAFRVWELRNADTRPASGSSGARRNKAREVDKV